MPNIEPNIGELARRPRGRPKGSKNSPNAGNVGRPRRDGQPPRNHLREEPSGISSSRTSLVSSRAGTPAICPAQSTTAAVPTADRYQPDVADHTNSGATIQTRRRRDASVQVDNTLLNERQGAEVINDNLNAAPDLAITGLVSSPEDPDNIIHDTRSLAESPSLPACPNTCRSPLSEMQDRMASDDVDRDADGDDIFDNDTGGGDEFCPVPDDEEAADVPEPAGLRESRSSMPTWLSKNYADLRERLSREMQKNGSKMPTCYDRHTFMDSSPFPYFAAQKTYGLKPESMYQPTYFVWLPHLLTGKTGIPCPNCLAASRKDERGGLIKLHAWSFTKAPRRVVDVDQCLEVVGYRYSCGHQECKKMYTSWSPALLSALPRALALQFPFHLTYRGGLSDQVVSMLRSSFNHGIGPLPFANMIRINHIRRYEQLHLQYLELIYARERAPYARYLPQFEPFGEFSDRDGYAGFEMDQYTSMLSSELLQIDHSFKVLKHVARLNGVPVYEALHTSVNEYSEIRSMTFTATKSHSQFMPALAAIARSLEIYGHNPVGIVVTDCPRGDKAELEAVLPSLRKDVIPVPDPKSIPTLSLPPDTIIQTLSTTYQVKTCLEAIMESVSGDEDYHAAVDMEWPVNIGAGIQGHVSLISITFGKEIFLIPLGSYMHNGSLHLPTALLIFLRTPCMRKVGVKIKGDFTRLFNDCGFKHGVDPPFVGALELGELAKEKNAVPRANVSLADLCSTILRKYLPKDPSIHVGEGWSAAPLSDMHANYAALDVHAAWLVFCALRARSHGFTVDEATPGGTPVFLYASDNSQPVAWGHIALDRPRQFGGVNVSKGRVLIVVKAILVPGHIMTGDLLSTHHDTPLLDFLPPPFTLLCKAKHVRTRSEPDQNLPAPPCNSHVSASINISELPQPTRLAGTSVPCDSELAGQDIAFSERWYLDAVDTYQTPADGDLSNFSRDLNSDGTAKNIIETASSMMSSVLRSRVLGDIWHLMDQFPISTSHALRAPFARALRDAIFLFDPEDKAAVEEFLQAQNSSWDETLLYHPDWLLQRVKRIVPSPEVLLPRVATVIHAYGPLLDPKSGQPLFNNRAWEIAANVLENLRRGYYSDPPNIPFYYCRGKDKNGLMRYRCIRGTNAIEGGIHQNIIRWFGAFNASPDFAVELLRDYTLIHNLKVGILNRTGVPYRGSYDVWTQNRISHLLDNLTMSFMPDASIFGPGGWVNGNKYQRTQEMFGVLPLPKSQKDRLGMHDFNSNFSAATKTRHQYLAYQQNTLTAILPVHTKAERALFRALVIDMSSNGLFSGRKQPNWENVAGRWSQHADGREIFYKLPEHLKAYWKKREESNAEKNAIKINKASYDEVARLLQPPPSAIPHALIANAQPISQQVRSGHAVESAAPDADGEVERWNLSLLLGRHSIQQFAIQYSYLAPEASSSQPRGNKRTHEEAAPAPKKLIAVKTRVHDETTREHPQG
ncbi:hypothetical protein JOM56_001763 [Amanita muscaria]